MNIAKFCIKHKVTTILAAVMVVLFGVMYGSQLQMALLPDMQAPMAVVMSTYVGASPSDMEELVTEPLEEAVMSVAGVESVQSTSSESVSTLMITYEDGTDTDIATTKLREKFNSTSLPSDASEPIIINMSISDMMPTAIIGLMGDDLHQLQDLAENTVAPALERIEGVAQVAVSGGLEQQISVDIDTSRAAGYGLSNSYIAQFLAGQNLLYPGGDLQNGTKTLTVSTDAKYQSVQDVANTLITLPTGGTVRLSEVAEVYLEDLDADSVASVSGTPCVILQISKQSGANEMEAAQKVQARLEELQAEDPRIQYYIPYIASDYIGEVTNSAFQNIIQGVLLAAIVVFLFLRRWSSTMAIAISMPVCILTVFVMMNVMDLTLNMMSMGGIAMGVGMIVDNSIVVLENINRFFAEGKGRMVSCVEGTQEVASSVVASTLTTMAVFVPLGLADGMAGMMFQDFCLTIASLIGASLVIALTLVPLLCYFMLDEEKAKARQLKQQQKKPNVIVQAAGNAVAKLNETYLKLLDYFTHHLKVGMLASVGLAAVFGLTLLNTSMVLIPDMDMSSVSISVSLPIGSEIEEATDIADRVSEIVEENCPEMSDMYYMAQSESVTVGVNLVGRSDRDRTANEIADDLAAYLQDIAGCEITVGASSMTSYLSGNDINVNITGDDYDTLEMIADDLTEQIAALPDTKDVTNSLAATVPQVKVTINREAAAQYGLTAASIGAAVRSELTGTTATAVTISSKEYDVVVKGDGAASASLDALASMPISSSYGGTVALSDVAYVTVVQAPQSITRVDQNRQVTISGSTISGDATSMTAQVNQILDNYTMPKGYEAETDGSYENMMESFGDLLFALAVALLLVYFVLAVQFESFAMPVMVMLILPVAFTGALFALPLTGRDLTMMALVSIIMLAGTVVN
ncbi:MAG: efflux RND transporter permease subunit, partial [Oscillibacter sp.]|nr:efflux RND transporter permease subunit [Oscillibacter sp.]